MLNTTRVIVSAMALTAILIAAGCSSSQTPPPTDNRSLIHVEFEDNVERIQGGDSRFIAGPWSGRQNR
jgi:hypothetical protein